MHAATQPLQLAMRSPVVLQARIQKPACALRSAASSITPGSRQHRARCPSASVSSSAVDTVITDEEVSEFWRKGYLVIRDFATPAECAALQARASEIVSAFEPQQKIQVFSTVNQKHDDYFTASANNVSCFFEEDAFDEAGVLRQAKELSISKLGHALHDVDPVFRLFSRSPRMQALFRRLGFRRPLPVQSMYIYKQPRIGGEYVPHQDSAFLATEPLSTVGLWLAVEDATPENGCLYVLEDSHHDGVLKRFVRLPDGSVGFPDGKPSWDLTGAKALPVPVGTLILLHGSNVHGSSVNTSPISRHAYSMHVVEGADGYRWNADNWLQRNPDFPFEPL